VFGNISQYQIFIAHKLMLIRTKWEFLYIQDLQYATKFCIISLKPQHILLNSWGLDIVDLIGFGAALDPAGGLGSPLDPQPGSMA